MILDKVVEIRIVKGNISHYKNVLNMDLKYNQKILVEVDLLIAGSSVKLNCKCDNCNTKTFISYKNYLGSYNKHNTYLCSKCKSNNTRRTNLEKYGVDNVMKLQESKDKIKSTCLKKYGVTSYTKTNDYINKTKETNIKNYGHEWRMQNVNEVSKYKDTCIEKYGVENTMFTQESKDKIKSTCLKKYGVENTMFTQESKDKIKSTCLKKYGVTSYTKTEEFKKKYKNTCIEKYGVDNVSKNSNIIKSILNKKMANGYIGNYLDMSLYENYRNRTNYLTRMVKKILIESWDGYDYYDNEYIRCNFSLNKNDNNYPSVDHKTSVMFGFLNNLTPKYISSIENLCITKRKINSSKFSMNENEFKYISNFI